MDVLYRKCASTGIESCFNLVKISFSHGGIMSHKKYYVVWRGRRTGIFNTWEQASAQVTGFAGARFKSFPSLSAAKAAFRQGPVVRERPVAREVPAEYNTKPEAISQARWMQLLLLGITPPITSSYCADAACRGNPGVMEYRSVKTETGEILLTGGPFPRGTSNIGEFLGIVETLMLLHKRSDASPIYSDSVNALAWVRQKRCKTQLVPDNRTAALFERIAAAEAWLRANHYPNKLLKWRTADWGEIPADYGRK